jgi:hypothetical protein
MNRTQARANDLNGLKVLNPFAGLSLDNRR